LGLNSIEFTRLTIHYGHVTWLTLLKCKIWWWGLKPYFCYSIAPLFMGIMFQDLPWLCETMDNTEC
jgi:hypothetical protein